jgi:GTPase subunit of restriction endonuclease
MEEKFYFSQRVLDGACDGLKGIAPGPGKKRGEMLSAIAYFLATLSLSTKYSRDALRLMPGSNEQSEFIECVAWVQALKGDLYTPDFEHVRADLRKAVSSNFLTKILKETRDYPSRPSGAPLLKISRYEMSIHPNALEYFVGRYCPDECRAHLAVWLLRGHGFDQDQLEAEEIKSRLTQLIGDTAALVICPSQRELDEVFGGVDGGLFSRHPSNPSFMEAKITESSSVTILDLPEVAGRIGQNLVIYGAPGTGKSFYLDNMLVEMAAITIRTVFHPDYQYSDFIGSVKPSNVNNDIAYSFTPGPFMKALKTAFQDPDRDVCLVVEEINRAPASAVFGDVFLLLDRRENGKSQYDIDFPSEDCERWFNLELPQPISKLYIPPNFSIYATMNSADQGVYHIDTAFKRRWKHKYLPLYRSDGPDEVVEYHDLQQVEIQWKAFVRCLNNYLASLGVPEDRLLGPYFIKQDELDECGGIPEKALHYLWDDVLRHIGRGKIFSEKLTSYGDLHDLNEKGGVIFAQSFIEKLNKVAVC